jgi:hypothetical protein
MLRVIRHNLMFCHQYPTRVVSAWDNVSSFLVDGSSIVRSGWDGSHQGGQGLGSCGRVNERESLIHVVTHDKRKMLGRLGQKARGQVWVLLTHPAQMLRHRRRGETSPTRALTRNVVRP